MAISCCLAEKSLHYCDDKSVWHPYIAINFFIWNKFLLVYLGLASKNARGYVLTFDL